MSNIDQDRRPVVGLLDELRKQFGSFYALAEEHLTEAQDEVNATGAKDHDALKFVDECAEIIWNHEAPLFKRVRLLTKLLAARENVVIT